MEPDITRSRRLRHACPCGAALALGGLLLGCTPQSPQPTEGAFPILTADARDDWNRYVDRRCAPEPVAVEPPECASEAIRSALDRHRRPPSPEVAACIERVASSWTFPPFESGWTTLGVTFDADAD